MVIRQKHCQFKSLNNPLLLQQKSFIFILLLFTGLPVRDNVNFGSVFQFCCVET